MGDSDVIMSATVTAVMLELYCVAAVQQCNVVKLSYACLQTVMYGLIHRSKYTVWKWPWHKNCPIFAF